MRMDQQAEKKDKTERVINRTRQKNKTGDSKVESIDSPEIPDRRETLHILGLPSGIAQSDSLTYYTGKMTDVFLLPIVKKTNKQTTHKKTQQNTYMRHHALHTTG